MDLNEPLKYTTVLHYGQISNTGVGHRRPNVGFYNVLFRGGDRVDNFVPQRG